MGDQLKQKACSVCGRELVGVRAKERGRCDDSRECYRLGYERVSAQLVEARRALEVQRGMTGAVADGSAEWQARAVAAEGREVALRAALADLLVEHDVQAAGTDCPRSLHARRALAPHPAPASEQPRAAPPEAL